MYCDKANFLNRIAQALRDSSIRSATLVVTLICALIAALVTFVTQRQVMQMQERFNNEVKEKELRENFLDIYQTLTVSLHLLMKQFDYFSRSASLKNISDNSFRSFESELMTLIAKVRVRLYVFKGESLFDEIHRLLKDMETCQKELTVLAGNDRVQRIQKKDSDNPKDEISLSCRKEIESIRSYLHDLQRKVDGIDLIDKFRKLLAKHYK